MCNNGAVEDETHFVFECETYRQEREAFLQNIHTNAPEFSLLSTNEKWKILMTDEYVNKTAQYVYNIYDRRQNILYQ